MKNKIRILGCGFLLTASFSASAVLEVEANQPMVAAQGLTVPSDGATIVSGLVGTQPADRFRASELNIDVDFFKIYASAGDVYTIDIDKGTGGNQPVDTIIAIFDENGMMLRTNDDADSVDEGSIDNRDPLIPDFKVPNTGYYTIGVAAYPQYFLDGGVVANSASSGEAGDYELIVSYARPSALQVGVVVKPEKRGGTARFNPKSRGSIPVAILGSVDLDVRQIDEASLRFGETGNEDSLAKCSRRLKDLNRDGSLDKICFFQIDKTELTTESLEGHLTGMTKQGISFEGGAALNVVPYRAEHHRARHEY